MSARLEFQKLGQEIAEAKEAARRARQVARACVELLNELRQLQCSIVYGNDREAGMAEIRVASLRKQISKLEGRRQ